MNCSSWSRDRRWYGRRPLRLYMPESRRKLTEVRSAAIRDGDGFTLDAQIVTAKGNPQMDKDYRDRRAS